MFNVINCFVGVLVMCSLNTLIIPYKNHYFFQYLTGINTKRIFHLIDSFSTRRPSPLSGQLTS